MSRRPQRQRASVQHYTDDNPSTFTVKRKRGDPMPKDPPKRYVVKSSTEAASIEVSSHNRSSETLAAKANRNSLNKRSRKELMVDRLSASSSPGVPTDGLRRTVVVDHASAINATTSVPQGDSILSHKVTLLPIIPPSINRTEDHSRQRLLDAHDPPRQLLSVDHSLQDAWSMAPLTYTQQEYEVENAASVELPFRATCLQQRQDVSVVGDASGQVSVYNKMRQPCMVYSTQASQRESQRKLTSRKTISFPNSLLAVDLRSDTLVTLSETELEVQRIVSFLRDEVEVNDAVNHRKEDPGARARSNSTPGGRSGGWSTLASPLKPRVTYATRRAHGPTSLRTELTKDASKVLLWGVVLTEHAVDSVDCRLWMVDARDNSQVVPLHTNILKICPSDSVLIDATLDSSSPEQVLAVVQPPYGNALLVRYSFTHSTILQQGDTGITFKTKQSECRIHVFEKLDKVLVCSHKGLRCHDRKSLVPIMVYGESVSLHGKAVVLQSCLLVDNPSFDVESVRAHKKRTYVYRADELAARAEARLEPEKLLLCVPHPSLGPTELRSTLYVYKLGDMTPIATLHAPPGGLLGISAHCLDDRWHLMCVTHEYGEVMQISSGLKSDFAGSMYPVGYTLIEDNIEYIEGEEELDTQIRYLDEEDATPINGRKSARSPRKKSIATANEEETARAEREADDVSVLLHSDDEMQDVFLLPAIPAIADEARTNPMSPTSPSLTGPQKFGFGGISVADLLPQAKTVSKRLKEIEEAREKEEADEDEGSGAKAKSKRGSRNIDHLLSQSVNPILRQRMIRLQQQWGDGKGATFDHEKLNSKVDRTVSNAASSEDKEIALDLLLLSPVKTSSTTQSKVPVSGQTPMESNGESNGVGAPKSVEAVDSDDETDDLYLRRVKPVCLACRGRMVLHSCGKRDPPVDYEAVERAERARQEALDAEERRLKAEKRRLADIRRKETRKKKKEEEERQRLLEAEQLARMRRQHDERMKRLESAGFGGHPHPAAAQTTQAVYAAGYSIPRYSQLQPAQGIPRYSDMGASKASNETYEIHQASTQLTKPLSSHHSSQNETTGTQGSYHGGDTIRMAGSTSPAAADLDPKELKPSTALSTHDALAALAGLACAETDIQDGSSNDALTAATPSVPAASLSTALESQTASFTYGSSDQEKLKARHNAILATFRAQINYERSNSGASGSVGGAGPRTSPASLTNSVTTPTNGVQSTPPPTRMMSPMDLLAATAETTAASGLPSAPSELSTAPEVSTTEATPPTEKRGEI